MYIHISIPISLYIYLSKCIFLLIFLYILFAFTHFSFLHHFLFPPTLFPPPFPCPISIILIASWTEDGYKHDYSIRVEAHSMACDFAVSFRLYLRFRCLILVLMRRCCLIFVWLKILRFICGCILRSCLICVLMKRCCLICVVSVTQFCGFLAAVFAVSLFNLRAYETLLTFI